MKKNEEEGLLPLVKLLKYQEYCELKLNEDVKDSHLVLHKNGLDVKGIESCFPQLKECNNEHLVRYIDAVKKNDKLWVVIPSRVDRIDCNGEL